MTDPSPARSRTFDSRTPTRSPASGVLQHQPRHLRRLAGLAVSVLGATLSTALGAAPATAAPATAAPATATAAPATATAAPACQANFRATAAADLLTLRYRDGRTTPGRTTPGGTTPGGTTPGRTTPDGTTSGSRAEVAGGENPAAAALANGVLAAKAEQHAPPTNPAATVVPTVGVDLAPVRFGAGELSAHASLTDAHSCDTSTGLAAVASENLASASVLAAPGGGRLADFGGSSTGTTATVAGTGGRSAATAVATANIADFTLFGDSSAPMRVRLLSQPTLRATAGASPEAASIEYSAPTLAVDVPGIGTRRIDAKIGHLDVAAPIDGGLLTGLDATAAGTAAGFPDLSSSLDELTDLLPIGSAQGSGEHGGPGRDEHKGSPDRPAESPAGSGTPGSRDARVAVLRISTGDATREINAGQVHATAVSIRLTLIVRSCGADGSGDDDRETSIADLGVGTLDVAAAEPAGGEHGDGAASGHAASGRPAGGAGGGRTVARPTRTSTGSADNSTGSADNNPVGNAAAGDSATGNDAVAASNGLEDASRTDTGPGSGGNLPVTGGSLGLFAGAGMLLVGGGALVLLLAVRRRTDE